ncbi:MAG: hypothetical protein KGS72_08305 [Cyanobacteria bacterium REEB67]|nr:hypothetical protein [Cyanobacteria bacterium REEB67]
MQNSKRVLSFINLQHSLLLASGTQTERLTIDLNRLDRTDPAYSTSVLVKTALKLISVSAEIGLTIADMLELSHNKAVQNQGLEEQGASDADRAASLTESHRRELVTLSAAARMQQILHAIAARCNENLINAHIKTMDEDQLSYAPGLQDLNTSLKTLRNLTMFKK